MYRIFKCLVVIFCVFLVSVQPQTALATETQGKVITFSGGEGSSIYADRVGYYAFKELGYDFSLLIQDITSASISANSDYTDGLLSVSGGIEKNYPNLVKVAEPISSLGYITFSRENDSAEYKSWADLSGKTVGLMTIGPHTELNLPKDAMRKRYQSTDEIYDALLNGEIEVAVALKPDETMFSPPDGLKQNPIFDRIPTYIYVNKKKEYLVPELENMLRKMKNEGITQKILNNELNHNDSKKKIVLSISSYSSDVLWERQLQDAFRAKFDEDIPMEVHNYSINALKLRNDIYYRKNLSSIIRRDFINKVPSVIIVTDDEAFEFVKENYYSTFSGAPVIFCAINDFTPERIKGFEHIFTGVVDKAAATETVDQMLKLYPETKKIYVVTDYTISGKQWRKDLEKQLEPYRNRLEVEFSENLSNDELVAKVATFEEGTLVLFGFYLVDGAGKYQNLTESQKAFFDNSKVPLFGLYYPTYGQGQLGGKYTVADVQARHVREILKQLLTGTKVTDIPIVTDTNKEYPWFFEYQTMKKFGIKKEQLPAGATITNVPPSFFETNKAGLIYASFVLAIVIISLLTIFTRVQRRKNNELIRIQKNLHSAEEMLQKEAELLSLREEQHSILMRMQADLQRVLDSVPVGILVREQNSLLPMYVNRAYVSMFMFDSVTEAEKYRLVDLSPEYQPNGQLSSELSLEHTRQIIESDATCTLDWQFKLPRGESVDARKISRTIFFNGESAIVTIIQDITADNKQRALLQSTAESEREANRIKSRFVVNISHEIRTPMNAIIGFTEIALLKDFGKEPKEIFKKVNTSARNLLNIINDVLDFSKIEAEKLELFEEEFNLEETLANAAMVASKRIGSKQIEMLLKIENDVPIHMMGDKTRLWQIFKNLLDNSAKFTTEGQVLLRVSADAESLDNKVVLTFVVTDTGLGMTPKQLERLFDSFEQFHSSQMSNGTGTGLGMTITKQLVELMGGTIHVASEAGIGTTTTIVIPFAKSGKDSLTNVSAIKDCLKDIKIVAADDSELSLEVMDGILKLAGCMPVCASTGDAVVDVIRKAAQNNETYDIVLLDYKMQDQNGFEIAKRIKALAPTTKIVMVSGYASHFTASDIVNAGFAAYVEKPFSSSELVQKLQDVLNIEQTPTQEHYQLNFSSSSVLVVEDNEINQAVAENMLEIFGIVPLFANNGKEALELMEQMDFDLILMDLLMPIMDGHEATKFIRASDKPYKNIPLIAMTANVVVEEINACIAEGMNGHISKPIDLNNLSTQLSKWLKSK